jgi:hypothetical protein
MNAWSWLSILLPLSCCSCGTSILLSYPLDTPFLRAHSDITVSEPIGPKLVRTRMTPDSGPLRIDCRTEEVSQWARETRIETFDGQGRVVVVFMAISEAAIATLFATHNKGKAENWIASGYFAVDAVVAGIYAITEPDQFTPTRRVGPGVPVYNEICPAGTLISGGGKSVPVDPSGKPQGDVAGMIFAVLQTGGTISVSAGGRGGTWNPNAQARCELAREINHPQTAWFCPSVPAPPTPGAYPSPQGWKPGRITIEVGGSVQVQGR